MHLEHTIGKVFVLWCVLSTSAACLGLDEPKGRELSPETRARAEKIIRDIGLVCSNPCSALLGKDDGITQPIHFTRVGFYEGGATIGVTVYIGTDAGVDDGQSADITDLQAIALVPELRGAWLEARQAFVRSFPERKLEEHEFRMIVITRQKIVFSMCAVNASAGLCHLDVPIWRVKR